MTEDDKILRAQAWDFFAVVAAQKLTVIHFYIGVATLQVGGHLALLQTSRNMETAEGLGFLLAALSFIFGKWDRRSSDLINLAEDTLKYYEERTEVGDNCPTGSTARLFTREHTFALQRKMEARWTVHHYFTYRSCLNLLFWMFSLIGISVALLCVAL